MIDIEPLARIALDAAHGCVITAVSTERAYGEGTTRDKALWKTIRLIATNEIALATEFDESAIPAYFEQFPEIASMASSRGSIAGSIRRAVVDAIFDRVSGPVKEVHENQYGKMDASDVRVWCDEALETARATRGLGQAISIRRHYTQFTDVDNADESLLLAIRSLSDAVNVPHGVRDVVLARRMEEVAEFVAICVERNAAADPSVSRESRAAATPAGMIP